MGETSPRSWWTIEEAAEHCHVSAQAMLGWCRATKKLKTPIAIEDKARRRWEISPAALSAYCQERFGRLPESL